MSFKENAKAGGVGVVGIILIIAGIFGMSYLSYLGYAFFAPKYEAVRRDTQIESRAYSEGMVRRLYDLKRQYEAAATPEAKATIVAAARHEYSIFPRDRMPPELGAWWDSVQ